MARIDLSKIEVLNTVQAALDEYRKTHTEEEVEAALKARRTLTIVGLAVMLTAAVACLVLLAVAIFGHTGRGGLLVGIGIGLLLAGFAFVTVFSKLSEEGRIASTRAWCDVQKLIK